jgi:purine-binding chemotaxis protein CheW
MSSIVKKPNRTVKKGGHSNSRQGSKSGIKSGKVEKQIPAAEILAPLLEAEEPVSPSEISPPQEGPTEAGGEEAGKAVPDETVASEPPVGQELAPAVPRRVEESSPPVQMEEKCELLGFLMNQEEYAIPISQIKEIIRPAEMTVIPGSPPMLLGIISLRGVIIPVFKVSNRLASLKVSEESKNVEKENENLKRIVIIQIDQGIFGLMVEGVTDVIKIKEEAIQSPPSLLNQMGQEMIKGITRFKNRLIILLFIERIVDVIQEEIKKIRKV